jgi:hypothetical protein
MNIGEEHQVKYYLVFINTLDGFETVCVNSYDSYEEQQAMLEKHNLRLEENGFDWLSFPQVEFHKVQAISEVN